MEIKCLDAITVYGASSRRISSGYTDAAFATGEAIARAGRIPVCGGGQTGVMGAAIDGAISAGGTTIGVLPQFMVDRQWQHPGLTHMIAMPDMHARKRAMATLSTGVIACPGGVGTFEELMEIITWRKLHLWGGNVVILNTNGYYDPLIAMLGRAMEENFMRPDDSTLWSVARTPQEAVTLASRPAQPADGPMPKE